MAIHASGALSRGAGCVGLLVVLGALGVGAGGDNETARHDAAEIEPPSDRTRLELEPAYSVEGPMRGRVRVVDEATGAERFSVLSPRVDDLFGYAGVTVGDVDGDGIEDFAASAPSTFDAEAGVALGRVYVMSGADGDVIREFAGEPFEAFGLELGVEGGEFVVGLELLGPEHAGGAQALERIAAWRSFALADGRMMGEDFGVHRLLAGEDRGATRARAFRVGPAWDLNADGVADGADLILVLEGLDGGAIDLDADGEVGLEDIRAMLRGLTGTGSALGGREGGAISALPAMITLPPTPGGNGPGGPGWNCWYEDGSSGRDRGWWCVRAGGMSAPLPRDPTGSGVEDDDGDGIPDDIDCDFGADPDSPPCQDDDGDGTWNQNEHGHPEQYARGGNCPPGKVSVTAIANLMADSDNNGAFDDPDEEALVDHDNSETHPLPTGPTERIEYEEAGQPGRIVMLNDDDDDADGTPDREQDGPLEGSLVDDELAEVRLSVEAEDALGSWSLSFGGGVRVYRGRDRSHPVLSDKWYDLPAPASVWVEGVTRSSAMGAAHIEFRTGYDCPTDEDSKTSDEVRLTVVELGVHDMRAWNVEYDEPSDTLSVVNEDPDGPSMPVGGAITDGASLCLVRIEPALVGALRMPLVDSPGYPLPAFTLAISSEQGSHNPSYVGTLTEVGRSSPGFWTEPLPPLPQPLPVSGDSSADFWDGLAFYVPPEEFRNSAFVQGSTPTETGACIFRLSTQAGVIGEKGFMLRRPPIVLVHGLMGSATNYWGPLAYSEIAGMPLPTRLYFADYEDTNTLGYSENLFAVHAMIEQALGEYRAASDAGHASSRGFEGIRYAATRVDVVGHSMGGQITRAYISNLGEHGLEVIQRDPNFPTSQNWAPAVFNRLAPDTRYLRADNYWAGTIRRFVAIGSPFKGSPIANAVEPHLKPTLRQIALLNEAGNLSKTIRDSHVYGLLWEPSAQNRQVYVPPTAVVDLAVGSAVQLEMEKWWRYPQGRQSVPWYPLVGIATLSVGEDPLQAILMELLLTVTGADADLTEFSELSPANSDLVVGQWSQRNATSELDYPNAGLGQPFSFHVHTFDGILPGGFTAEALSIPMSNDPSDGLLDVAELLSSPASFMNQGELH